tara:strand:- start:1197 stop:1358 length:162 start_codon:yes stop_codon:yes gene_type:complete
VPEDFTIEKLLSPIFVKVIPEGEPIALLRPFLISFVFWFDEVNVDVVPSIVIE